MDVRLSIPAALLAAALAISAPCPAQSTHAKDLAQGKILVAPRDPPDPHFAKSVIVLAQYNSSGALGLMLQYHSKFAIGKALAGVKAAEKRTDTIFIGGPVEIPVVLALLRSKSAPEGALPVTGNLYLMTSKQSIGAALTEDRPASDLHLFLGYSGWGAGQLEYEVRQAGWYIFDYDESLIFDDHPETLWDRLIGKTEQNLAALR